MLYTVKKMAEISGVSTRTLRYYDEISLLKPAQINESGYRLYGEKEINRLQQILFYRELNPDYSCTKFLTTAKSVKYNKLP